MQTRGVIAAGAQFYSWILAFLALKYFPIMVEMIGLHYCIVIFLGVCLLTTVFIVIYMPETKGISIEEIIILLGGDRKVDKIDVEKRDSLEL